MIENYVLRAARRAADEKMLIRGFVTDFTKTPNIINTVFSACRLLPQLTISYSRDVLRDKHETNSVYLFIYTRARAVSWSIRVLKRSTNPRG